MEIRDQKAWDRYSRTYRAGTMTFARLLANLIESRMSKNGGTPLKDVLDDSVQDVVNCGDASMPASQRAEVVEVLTHTWVHGEEFKRWIKL